MQYIKSLFSSADNGLFLHYVYLDNNYVLPTGSGVPLKFGVHSTVTPGITGGLKFSPDMVHPLFTNLEGFKIDAEKNCI